MFIHKLRTVAMICQKQGLGKLMLRSQYQPTLQLPSISFLTRQFSSRFGDFDDEDDYVPRSQSSRRQNNWQDDGGNRRPRSQSNNNRFQNNNRFSSNKFQNNRFSSQNNEFANMRNPSNRGFAQELQAPDWNSITLKEIKKDFYQPHEKTLNRSDDEIRRFREEHEITVQRGAPKPILEFDELANIPATLLKEIERHGFEKATPIQSQVWPIALSGKNLVGIAQTGSGKTLGFILPAIVHILNQPKVDRRAGPIALVMAPTRELAQQIQEVARQFGISSGIHNACCYGGSAKSLQVQQLNRGYELVIGTPGRLIDLVQCKILKLQQVSYLVLDEADRMLDMGFEPQIRQIVAQTRPDRQTLMFSATWPREIRKLASEFLREFDQVNVGSLDLCANHNIKQIIKICTPNTKEETLQDVMKEIHQKPAGERKTLIFANQKRTADQITWELKRMGIQAQAIHSDKSQNQREQTLHDFRDGRIDVMVATEVAARGLDVNNIKYVINYDYPMNSTDYVHRIGRTGRSGNTGTAYTLLTHFDGDRVDDLINVMKEAKQEIDPELLQLGRRRNRF